MPRIIIEHLKLEKSSRPISIELDGVIICEVACGQVDDVFVFNGEHQMIAKIGGSRSDPVNISVQERELISIQCWSTGILRKSVHLRKIIQKKQSNRFAVPGDNINKNEPNTVQPSLIEASWASILGVRHDATMKEVRSAYIMMMKKNHPDKISQLSLSQRKAAEERAIEVTVAYNYAKKLINK